MADKKPDYQDWNRKPDFIVVFGGLVWGLAYLTSFLRPGPHVNSLFGH